MADNWVYTGLRALNSGQKVGFLGCLSDELYEWTKDVVKTLDEFPVGYTEWTLTGHMNIVAHRCGFMPYSDYVVKLVKGKKKILAGIARPDLHIHNKGWGDSWIFELKRDSISLVSTASTGDHILEKLKKAHDQLLKIAKNCDSEWAAHICSALACTVWMNTHTGKERWQKRWSHPEKYKDDWQRLWDEEWEGTLRERASELNRFGRIYYCGYRMPHSSVVKHYKTAVKEAEGKKAKPGPIPIGVFWVFAHKLWTEVTVS